MSARGAALCIVACGLAAAEARGQTRCIVAEVDVRAHAVAVGGRQPLLVFFRDAAGMPCDDPAYTATSSNVSIIRLERSGTTYTLVGVRAGQARVTVRTGRGRTSRSGVGSIEVSARDAHPREIVISDPPLYDLVCTTPRVDLADTITIVIGEPDSLLVLLRGENGVPCIRPPPFHLVSSDSSVLRVRGRSLVGVAPGRASVALAADTGGAVWATRPVTVHPATSCIARDVSLANAGLACYNTAPRGVTRHEMRAPPACDARQPRAAAFAIRVNRAGHVESPPVLVTSSGCELFDLLATDWARNTSLAPARLGAEAVEAWAVVTIAPRP